MPRRLTPAAVGGCWVRGGSLAPAARRDLAQKLSAGSSLSGGFLLPRAKGGGELLLHKLVLVVIVGTVASCWEAQMKLWLLPWVF